MGFFQALWIAGLAISTLIMEVDGNQPAVCKLPSKTGKCRAAFRRYHYDTSSGRCREFIYGGCGSNGNNFHSMSDCRAACVCTLNHASGSRNCNTRSRRQYYYNTDTDTCTRFRYTGCGRNGNRFSSASRCRSACAKSRCYLPADGGLCKSYFPRYFYNSETSQCERFVWGGCGGNSNNFQLRQTCEDQCPVRRSLPEDTRTTQLPPTVSGVQNQPTRETISELADPGNSSTTPGNQPNDCLLPRKIGPCGGRLRRYYFKGNTGSCQQFLFGGCAGNANNFRSMRACRTRCGGSSVVGGFQWPNPLSNGSLANSPAQPVNSTSPPSALPPQPTAQTLATIYFGTSVTSPIAGDVDTGGLTTQDTSTSKDAVTDRSTTDTDLTDIIDENTASKEAPLKDHAETTTENTIFEDRVDTGTTSAILSEDATVNNTIHVDKTPSGESVNTNIHGDKTTGGEPVNNTFDGDKTTGGETVNNTFDGDKTTGGETVNNTFDGDKTTSGEPVNNTFDGDKTTGGETVNNTFDGDKTTGGETVNNTFDGDKTTSGEPVNNTFDEHKTTSGEPVNNTFDEHKTTSGEPVNNTFDGDKTTSGEPVNNTFDEHKTTSGEPVNNTFDGDKTTSGEPVNNTFDGDKTTSGETVNSTFDGDKTTSGATTETTTRRYPRTSDPAFGETSFSTATTGLQSEYTTTEANLNVDTTPTKTTTEFKNLQESPTDDTPTVGISTKEICQLPAVPGTCKDKVLSFFFNWTSGQCMLFVYGGCQGNKNRFKDRVSCNRVCKKVWLDNREIVSSPGGSTIGERLRLPKITPNPLSILGGLQSAYENNIPRLVMPRILVKRPYENTRYIDTSANKPRGRKRNLITKALSSAKSHVRTARTTEVFVIYGGRSSQNVIADALAAFRSSLSSLKNRPYLREVCGRGLGSGRCRSHLPMFFFSTETLRCEKLTFSSCAGNRNAFSAEDECVRACVKPDLNGTVK